jgi:hypothetical protein
MNWITEYGKIKHFEVSTNSFWGKRVDYDLLIDQEKMKANSRRLDEAIAILTNWLNDINISFKGGKDMDKELLSLFDIELFEYKWIDVSRWSTVH